MRGFTTIDRQTTETSADHVRLVKQVLEKFHAISFALKDQQPEKFNEFASKVPEETFRPSLMTHLADGKIILGLVSNPDILEKVKPIFNIETTPDVVASCLAVA